MDKLYYREKSELIESCLRDGLEFESIENFEWIPVDIEFQGGVADLLKTTQVSD